MTSHSIRVHALQVAYGDDESDVDRIDRVAELVAAQREADLVVLPELWAPGYFHFSTWKERSETEKGRTVAVMAEAARAANAIVHIGSILEREHDRSASTSRGSRGLWNTSVLLAPDGSVLGRYRKIHPFGFGEGEPTLIDAGSEIAAIRTDAVDSSTVFGLATCYDLRFPELFRELSSAGATVFLVPAAWPAARREHWQILGRARAIENQAFMVQVNTGGTHGGVDISGHSQIISPRGEVLARAGADEEVLIATLDLGDLHDYRRSFPVLADRRLGGPFA